MNDKKLQQKDTKVAKKSLPGGQISMQMPRGVCDLLFIFFGHDAGIRTQLLEMQAGITSELWDMECDEVMASADSLRTPPDRQGFWLRAW